MEPISIPVGKLRVDLTNQKIGKLTVVSRAPDKGAYKAWNVRCECGTWKVMTTAHLRCGNARACGCSYERHGMHDTKTYRAWTAMRARCFNPNNPGYHLYGGRGITVCSRWAGSFIAFLEDMGEAPEGMSLDRFPDRNGNYEPGNCRWATPREQARNVRSNRRIQIGDELLTVIEWSERSGVSAYTIISRLGRKWDAHRAVFHPVRVPNPNSRKQPRSRAKNCWRHMIERCYSKRNSSYKNYGGRGIAVCDRWRVFANFVGDMGEPLPSLSLDRIDVNGNYCPENCRWVDSITQANNMRRSIRISYNGESLGIAEWARKLGLSRQTIYSRVKRGLPPRESLKPVRCAV